MWPAEIADGERERETWPAAALIRGLKDPTAVSRLLRRQSPPPRPGGSPAPQGGMPGMSGRSQRPGASSGDEPPLQVGTKSSVLWITGTKSSVLSQ